MAAAVIAPNAVIAGNGSVFGKVLTMPHYSSTRKEPAKALPVWFEMMLI